MHQSVVEGNYAEALKCLTSIEQAFIKHNAADSPTPRPYELLQFLWDKESDNKKMPVTLSLKELLEIASKCGKTTLPPRIQNTLETALSPPDDLQDYILKSTRPDSEISHHCQMTRESLKQPVNNSITTGVYQLGVITGNIEPIFSPKQEAWQKELLEK